MLQVALDTVAIARVVNEFRLQPLQVGQQQGLGNSRALTGKGLLVETMAQKATQPFTLVGITIRHQVIDGDKAQRRPTVRIRARQHRRRRLAPLQQVPIAGAQFTHPFQQRDGTAVDRTHPEQLGIAQ
ncbi:hypothetical protein D3C84_668900 [compost metagenome]